MDGENLLKLIFTSRLRRDLILALGRGPKVLRELQNELRSTPSSILHALKALESRNIVRQNESTREYELTNIGYLVYIQLKNVVDSLEAISKFENFWLTHDVKPVPEEFLKTIGSLKNSKLVVASPDELKSPHELYTDLIKRAKWVRAISSVVFREYSDAFLELAFKGADIEAILPEKTYEKFINMLEDKELGALKKLSNMRIYTLEWNPRVSFTVTDYVLAFGLLFPDGRYDMTMDLVSYDPKARKWALDLFHHYKQFAKRVL
ncbi:winged helix-turn-helix domain-containing protein [Thermococcus sp. SY098]|uniref:helix-turn-helix transcriptional regulator n=1 Tax=Thermococcus sp. SY098 TaxID=3111325 RepID=UPI002D76C559|nr:winged helix-turn-helix domain-containing protein [Thermococcus sp. SY098]WRS52858.1 winged helix-turn-helix domain-containing protein [Thermococcus sp. SY098]